MQKMIFGNGQKLSRRKFIVGSAAAAGGGLALGFNLPFGQFLAPGAESLGRGRCTAMRLLPVRPDHGRGGAAEGHPETDR